MAAGSVARPTQAHGVTVARSRCGRAKHLTRPGFIACLGTTLALLCGCAGEPTARVEKPAQEDSDISVTPFPEPDETPFSASLAEAERLLSERQPLAASSILRGFDRGKLTPGERARVLAMEIALLHLQGQSAEALSLLRRRSPLLGPIHPVQQQRLDDWQLRLVSSIAGPLATARLADRLLLISEDPQRSRELADHVWHNLQRMTVDELQAQIEQVQPAHWRGWLELAMLAADVMESPDAQAGLLSLWRERYPDHRASETLPGGLDTLEESALKLPGRMALLLPLSSGPSDSGRAALEGFLAAQFLARQRGWPRQELMIMDSADYADLNAAYASAVRAGADIVIGPLTPEMAGSWKPADSERTVPLLSLALLPGEQAISPPVQLNLEPEDEARQLAEVAFDSGARKALIVRPEGDWGDRVTDALMGSWGRLAGKVRAIAVYSNQADYSSSLKTALNLSASEGRATRLRRLLAEPTEFTPRRREDFDVIFLLSESPQQARSLKPLLAFHYAGDVPVYATSHIFNGRRDPQRDRDLNGTRILETPWTLEPNGLLPATLSRGGAEEALSNSYALGADAFMLNWRLAQLRESAEARVRGQTGLLSMDANGRVHRELKPALIQDGVPEPL